ncbi:hypothetical protein PF010_g6717 [Phytophthora fragariae]|uniref:Uncharacterized protein n=1 Tax=Phytophthora fragariae TaxID=53985 RepID=A0A6A3FEZ0_9STRA|nr:hypothetical protein PF003_g19382 [Phytophthora fragariae]KAE8944199.1 hypothetical protein PF009_g6119 [Phytophthora fragariae]KAE9122505.1 hypothetical protein PF010_g6717 [Phytophthora fragariae]KAE9150346.1 hypothetical protein PF006_g5265 [Phytophthora fragariae]
MAAPAKMRLRSEKHLANITKRGLVSQPQKVRQTLAFKRCLHCRS